MENTPSLPKWASNRISKIIDNDEKILWSAISKPYKSNSTPTIIYTILIPIIFVAILISLWQIGFQVNANIKITIAIAALLLILGYNAFNYLKSKLADLYRTIYVATDKRAYLIQGNKKKKNCIAQYHKNTQIIVKTNNNDNGDLIFIETSIDENGQKNKKASVCFFNITNPQELKKTITNKD